MKLKVEKNTLIHSLGIGGLMAGKDKSFDLAAYSLFYVKGNSLSIISTSKTVQVQKTCEVISSEKDITFCIDTKPLLSFLKLVKSDSEIEIDIQEDKNIATVLHSRGSADFNILSATDFPLKGKESAKCRFDIDSNILQSWMVNAETFCYKGSERPIMQCLYLYLQDKTAGYCASDTTMLVTDEFSGILNCEGEGSVMIPSQAFLAIKSILSGTETASVEMCENNVVIETENGKVRCSLVIGKYPNFKSIIPSSCDVSVGEIQRNDIIDSVSRLIISQEAQFISIDVNESNVSMEATSSNHGSISSEDVKCESDGETHICLDANKLQSVISSISSDRVRFLLSGPRKSALILDEACENKKILLMPYYDKK